MRVFTLLASFALAAITGCTVGPDFTRPDPGTPADWTGTVKKDGIGSDAAITDAWWSGFNDPELASLIARARDKNPNVRLAALRIEEARAQLEAVGARDLPTLGLDSSYARTGLSPNGALSLFGGGGPTGAAAAANAIPANLLPFKLPPFDLFQTGFDASWEIDLFGGVRRGVEAAEAEAQALAEDRNDALIAVYAEIARDYIQLRGVQRLIAITEDNIRAQRDSYNLTHAQAQGGETSNLDVESASAEVATTESQLPALEDQKTHAINAIGLLLGEQPGVLDQELATAQPMPTPPAFTAIGLPSDLARRRPDIRHAEAELHAATANIGVATADLYPKLSLTGSLGVQAIRFQKLGDWGSRFYNAGPSLSIPVFNGPAEANIKVQESRQKEAAITYQTTVLSGLHEVENAVSSYSAERARLGAVRRAAEANVHALALARQRYKAGLSSFLDVLDAERRTYASQTAVVQSDIAIATDLIAVYKALGGGWDANAGAAVPEASATAGKAEPVAAK